MTSRLYTLEFSTQTDAQTDERTDTQTDAQTDERTDTQTDAQTDKLTETVGRDTPTGC